MDGLPQIGDREGLTEVRFSLPPVRQFASEHVGVSGDDQGLQMRAPFAEPLEQFVAEHRRHQVVGDHEIEGFTRSDERQRRVSVRCDRHLAV